MTAQRIVVLSSEGSSS